jgi:hypothetical protein
MVVALILSCAASPGTAWSARWFDKLPADDPDPVRPREVFPSHPPMPVASPEVRTAPIGTIPRAGAVAAVGGLLGGVYNAASGILWSTTGAVQTVTAATREAWWEAAYMFGVNGTPVPRSAVSDPVGDLAAARDDTRAGTLDPLAGHEMTENSAGPERPNEAAANVALVPGDSAKVAPIDPGLLANFIYDRGARRPDGSYFVPKPLQRLFEIRTRAVAAAEVPVALSLAGRIVADPRSHGAVEASLLGRIEPGESGIPVLGQTVHEGDILAYVVPAVGVVDRSQVRREVARLTTEIRVDTESLEILRRFSFVPFRDGKIYQAEQHVAGLRRERDALLPLLGAREVLRASADGVVSASTAIAGRIVHPGEAVFTIVDANRLWVEASAADPMIAASAANVREATAITPEGQSLALTFVGSGLTLREQSVPVLFRIDSPPKGLRIGRPVTVTVRSETRSQRGLPLTRDALTIGTDGVQEVWEQSAPEVFVPRAVRTVDLDGRDVLVIGGLKEGARVVVKGVRLLAQLQ